MEDGISLRKRNFMEMLSSAQKQQQSKSDQSKASKHLVDSLERKDLK